MKLYMVVEIHSLVPYLGLARFFEVSNHIAPEVWCLIGMFFGSKHLLTIGFQSGIVSAASFLD